MRTILGIDAGGSRTRAVLADESGSCLSIGRSGAGNPLSAGRDLAIASLVAATTAAVAATPTTVERPSVVMVTMAGGATIGGRLAGLDEALALAGLPVRAVIKPDTLSAYFSATPEPAGGVLVVGTGAVAAVVADHEMSSIIDGAGWLTGDDGSGFWIGRRVVHDVLAALDGRGPATALTADLMALLPAPAEGEAASGGERARLLNHVYAQRPVELAQYAPLAFAHPEDLVASAIIDDAVAQLTHTLDVLTARVTQGPIVLGGGVLGTVIGDRLSVHAGERALRASDGTVGAVALGLHQLGVDVTTQLHAQIVQTLAALGS